MSTRDAVAILAGGVLIVSLFGNSQRTQATSPAASPLGNGSGTRPGLAPVTAADRQDARALITRLRVKPRGARTGYSRSNYGADWADTAPGVPYAGNGCRTRDDLLARDGRDLVRAGCRVLSMTLTDPYTGRAIDWRRKDAGEVQVDHVVPLSYAWRMAAKRWPMSKRLDFANDPLNLLPVYGRANEAKDGSGPAGWLPPRRGIRCAYVTRFAQVALKYGIPVTRADKRTMLAQCG
ncbi:HNH endonuclease family protein [Nonomuraea typhae]|uniref:HNH endonuclease family protein n=1 Tax=Nonomuraea typhae TaxID=2603600 RepID=UPI0012FC18DE|nr:HNH endonuclease family protein [Nonomuraea typhae]